MQRFLPLFFIFLILSCQEEANPIIQPNTNPGNGNGGPNPDETPVEGKYANCLSVLSDTTIDIVTWNIEHFPKEGTTTINLLKEMITAMDADIIGVQEIDSETNFNNLVADLDGYAGKLYIENSQAGVGYLYKTSEITSLDNLTPLFTDDNNAFPRPAILTTATHVSGQQIKLINVHLKCCDDGNSIERRLQASVSLKNYIDQNLSNNSVIVLGDFNEDIIQPEGNNVFTNFVNDPTDYRFADMDIAEGSSAYWSYPDWPSHLDHLLITNELFDQVYVTKTIRFNDCESGYSINVSDHNPVMLRLTAE